MITASPILFDKLSLQSDERHKHWRDVLLRDIEHLLNDATRSADLKLKKFPHCQTSVMNYGLPPLSQSLPINSDPLTLARHIQQIIATFEPRLDPRSIKVTPLVDADQNWVLAILFDIHARSFLAEEELSLRIALDYSHGTVQIF